MRFNTSAFGSKWCGLWDGNKKLMDYYAIKINDTWLGPHNCYRFVKINNMAEHWYKTNKFEIKERTVLGNGLSIEINVKSKFPENIRVGMEVGVNIRDRVENVHNRKYVVDRNSEVRIVNEKGSLVFGKGNFDERDEYKTHKPGNYQEWWKEEEQSVFVPGFMYEDGVSKKSGSLFKFYIEKPAEKSENTGFYQKGRGVMAGFPWFLQVWGRDSGFIIPAYTNKRKYEWARDSLRILASLENDGRIPNYIEKNPVYNSIDAGPLFVIAAEHYIRRSKDKTFLPEIEENIKNILNSQVKRMIKSRIKETWMDTLDRTGYNIDVQSVWAEAYKAGYKLLDNKDWIIKHELLRKKINHDFWDGEFFLDTLGKETKTANPVFPLFFGLVEKERAKKAFEVLESEEFLTNRGLRSVSKEDSSYDPQGYHQGMVWGLLTGMLAYAERRYGRKNKSNEILKIIRSNKNLRCIDGIDEVYDGDTGIPSGCCSQAWSEIWETRIKSELGRWTR